MNDLTPQAANNSSDQPENSLELAAAQAVEELCATVVDYPTEGIVFKDLTPVFADGHAFKSIVDALIAPFAGKFDAVAGVEARGFLLAAAAAYASGTGVITVRKAGKLPREVFAQSYALEYGHATLELHQDDVEPGTRVLILDDVLATGGTLSAAAQLLERSNATVVGIGVVMELDELGGRENLAGHSVVTITHV